MAGNEFEVSEGNVNKIVEAMGVETPHQMVRSRLENSGVFAYLKDANIPLPSLDDSDLRLVNCGLMYDFGQTGGGIVDSFLVYDPARIEIKFFPERPRAEIVERRGRTSNSEREKRQPLANETSSGWIIPFPKSRGRVVGYRPVIKTQPES